MSPVTVLCYRMAPSSLLWAPVALCVGIVNFGLGFPYIKSPVTVAWHLDTRNHLSRTMTFRRQLSLGLHVIKQHLLHDEHIFY